LRATEAAFGRRVCEMRTRGELMLAVNDLMQVLQREFLK
jgi:hypothetical protein